MAHGALPQVLQVAMLDRVVLLEVGQQKGQLPVVLQWVCQG